MARKEHKGGILTNEELENELARTAAEVPKDQVYRGSQDTGDQTVRQNGSAVQQQDGTGGDGKENV